MSLKTARFLMLWFFVALQTMTPFIHAHAGAVQLNHGGLLHLHQGVHGDAAYHAIAAHEHGAEVEVAQGMPARATTLGAATDAQPVVSGLTWVRTDTVNRPGAGLPAPPPLVIHPDFVLPHALAPPAA